MNNQNNDNEDERQSLENAIRLLLVYDTINITLMNALVEQLKLHGIEISMHELIEGALKSVSENFQEKLDSIMELRQPIQTYLDLMKWSPPHSALH